MLACNEEAATFQWKSVIVPEVPKQHCKVLHKLLLARPSHNSVWSSSTHESAHGTVGMLSIIKCPQLLLGQVE